MEPINRPIPSPSVTTSRPALVDGGPLHIDAWAPRTLTEALRRTAELHPQKGIHVFTSGDTGVFVTYPELLRRARAVLSGLRASGLTPGSKVILQIDSIDRHFAAFWGCLLGGIIPTTVAIAPTYSERNGVIDKLCNTWKLLEFPVIITSRNLQAQVEQLAGVASMSGLRTLRIEDLLENAPAADTHSTTPDDIAFIQLSSGSTGVPKCIQERHGSIIAHIHSSAQFNGYSPTDTSLNWLPMDHVVPILTCHLKDTYLGCQQIHVATSAVLNEPLLWLDLMARFRVTHTWSPNFGFKLVADRLSNVLGRRWDLSSLRFFMNAGEQVTMPVVREFLRAVASFGVRESAMQPAFGMAEVCTCMTYANNFSLTAGARRYAKSSLGDELQPARDSSDDTVEFVSLGKVTPGIAIRIADTSNEVLPENRIGRLQIKGPVVTPGYYHNDDANRDAFVGDGWFNTGDLGFIADGELFLTGREKEMIIVRGAKFYCYEVEDVVNSVPGVLPTFAAACGTGDVATGTEALAIFFVSTAPTSDGETVREIRRTVTGKLGILPQFIVPLSRDRFPKTTSGKIQRTQLKKLLEAGAFAGILSAQGATTEEANTSDMSEFARHIAAIWEDVLGRKNIPISTHLFEAGGDSLKATQIASRIRERWQTDFPFHLLFGATGTIEGMAIWLEQNSASGDADAPPPIRLHPRPAMLPLSYSQLRIWMADQISPGSALYNIGRALNIRGPLQFSLLQKALHAIVQRHEILRTVYAFESIPIQRVLPEMALPVPRHDLAHLEGPEQTRVVTNLLAMEVARPFDLSAGPLLRAKLIRLGDESHILMLTCHQIVTDAWSLGLLGKELAIAYERSAAGSATPLEPLAVQYADYAAWQQRWLSDAALEKQAAFWRKQIATPPAPLQLGEDATHSEESEVQQLTIEGALLDKLHAFNASENSTSFMTLLTVYNLLLADWAGATDIAVGSPESGRRRFEIEPLLGCFVNMLTIRTRLRENESFRTLLGRVRSATIEAFSNADLPFEKVQALVSTAAEHRTRLFQTWFGPMDSLEPFAMGDVSVSPQPVFPPVGQFDLACFVSEQQPRIVLFFEHRSAVVGRHIVQRRIQQFTRLLEQALESPDTGIAELVPSLLSLRASSPSMPHHEPVPAEAVPIK